MGVVKLSSSGLQVQFISDDGSVFVTSRKFLEGLLSSGSPGRVLVLGLLPNRVSVDRFPMSVVWNPDARDASVDGVSVNRDVLSRKASEVREVRKGFVDKEVW
jgi:hypothetical protein